MLDFGLPEPVLPLRGLFLVRGTGQRERHGGHRHLQLLAALLYCFSVCFLHEKPSFGKICGVFTSFVGVTMVVMFQDGSDVGEIAGTSLVAGLLVVVSAALYRGYVVALRLAVGDDITDTTTLLAMTGLCELFTVPLSIVGSFALAYSPFESLQEPLGFP